MQWNWIWLAGIFLTAAVTAQGIQRSRVLAKVLYFCMILALTGAWPTWPLRWMWFALSLIAGGGLALWEAYVRQRLSARVQSLRRYEGEGKGLETVLLMAVALVPGMQNPPKPKPDMWPRVSEWIDNTRAYVRSLGGDRYADIFNDTGSVRDPENFKDLPNMRPEIDYLRMVYRHLQTLRRIIHEQETGRIVRIGDAHDLGG